MGQAPPPESGKPLPKAKLNALEVNKKQWGIGAEGGAAAPAAKKAAPAPKKAAPKKGAAAAEATVGFSGVPADFAKAGQAAYAADDGSQTFLGMGGPRAPGHREKFGGKHAATMLALSALLFQPISQAGMYTVSNGQVTKNSFEQLQVPGWGNLKSVPTIESLFPFDKTGFEASPVLFSSKSMLVVENPLGQCGAFDNTKGDCHSFFDEISDAMKKTPETPSRAPGKASFSFPWAFEKAAWNK